MENNMEIYRNSCQKLRKSAEISETEFSIFKFTSSIHSLIKICDLDLQIAQRRAAEVVWSRDVGPVPQWGGHSRSSFFSSEHAAKASLSRGRTAQRLGSIRYRCLHSRERAFESWPLFFFSNRMGHPRQVVCKKAHPASSMSPACFAGPRRCSD